MKQYEYMAEWKSFQHNKEKDTAFGSGHTNEIAWLNRQGDEGWELVSVNRNDTYGAAPLLAEGRYYFKREITGSPYRGL